MNRTACRTGCIMVGLLVAIGGSAFGKQRSPWFDPARHLPIEKVQAGMKGYGITIFYGTQAEKFDVKILDIIHNMEPHRDMILAQVTGHDLERTGVVHGMSGSPAYLQDPADGKYKLIGAVAYGWDFSREGPVVCGIQPVEEMLGVPPERPSQEMLFVSADPSFTPTALSMMASLKTGQARPLKEFDRFYWAGLVKDPKPQSASAARNPLANLGLKPMAIPLGVSGLAPQTFSSLSSLLSPLGIVPVKTGMASSGTAGEAPDAKLVPAGVLSVPLVLGDLNLDASGTVTEVIGDKFWGFGHPLFNQGPLELPISAGRVHAFIPFMPEPFKLASPSKPIGTLYADQGTAVAGKVGSVPKMVPFNVSVNFCGTVRQYHFDLAIHQKLAPLLAMVCLQNSILAEKDLPELHAIRYTGHITFDRFGKTEFGNTSSDGELGMLLADVVEPINLMLNNDFQRVKFTGINVNLEVIPRSEQATILQAKLDKPQYKPGETARVELLLTRVRGPEFTQTVSFKVPEDFEDGEYEATIGGIETAISADRRSHPYVYNPSCVDGVFQAIQRVESFRSKRFYVAVNTHDQGLGIRCDGLKQLPCSKLQQLADADPGLTKKFTSVRLFPLESQFVVAGQDQLKLVVSRNP